MAYEFTDYEGVRAILGVSSKELSDATLSLKLYRKRLNLDLKALGEDILTHYVTAAGEETSVATDFVEALDIFAAYSFASYCITGLPQFSLKSITDGKAAQSRYAESPIKTMIATISTSLYAVRQRLSELYATYLEETSVEEAPRTLFALSEPDEDTVTEE